MNSTWLALETSCDPVLQQRTGVTMYCRTGYDMANNPADVSIVWVRKSGLVTRSYNLVL